MPLDMTERDASVGPHLSVVGSKRESAVITFQSFVVALECVQGNATIVPGLRVIRHQRNRPVVADQGLAEAL